MAVGGSPRPGHFVHLSQVSETGVKVADINSGRMVIRLEQGKGGRDRYVMLPPQLLGILRFHWLAQPARWLGPGGDGEHPTGPTVLQAACRSTCAASA